ncbi:MAG: citrate/2-methylcitrate synthase [Acidimicrobiales bacterium]
MPPHPGGRRRELVGIVSLRDLIASPACAIPARRRSTCPGGSRASSSPRRPWATCEGRSFFHYRQFSAVELAERRSLEDVWALLFDGALPDRDGLAAFAAQVAARRALPPGFDALVDEVAARAPGTGPLDGLRTVLSAVAAAERASRRPTTSTAPPCAADALRLAAVTTTVVAALHRRSLGLAPVAPRSDLAHAANYLWMVNGEVPDPEVAQAVEQYLMLTVDHGFNASTFTARHHVDRGRRRRGGGRGAGRALGPAPRRGAEPGLALLDEIGTAERAPAHIRDLVEQESGSWASAMRSTAPTTLVRCSCDRWPRGSAASGPSSRSRSSASSSTRSPSSSPVASSTPTSSTTPAW